MSQVQVTTLDNGLRVATETMPTVETASVGVWIEAGARDEAAHVNGVSHYLEHMAFKGTRRRDARSIAEEIEAVGGHLNAHTSREYTAYYSKVLKNDVALAADVVADIVRNMTLEPAELERERTVIVQEILEALDTPDDVVFERFQETAYPAQSIGRSVLGSVDGIRNMPREALMSYRQANYRASRMVFAAAGRVTHKEVVALADNLFGDLEPGDEPRRDVARYVGGDWRDHRDLEQVHLILGFESVPFRHPQYYATAVLSTVLGGGMSSRLFQEVREQRGLVYSIYSFPTSFADSGVFGIYAGTGEKEIEEVVPLVCNEVRRLADDVTEQEVARARAQLKASILMSLESTSARCEQLARQLIVFERPLPIDEIVSRIEDVKARDVAGAARRLASGPMTLTALGPIGRLESYETVAQRLHG